MRNYENEKKQCLFCSQDASSNKLGRNEVNTKDEPQTNPNPNANPLTLTSNANP